MTVRDNIVAERILHAAVRLFSERGYAATSTREIAEAAGITKPMLYYYYESKEGLCRAALQHYQDQFRQKLDCVREADFPPIRELSEIIQAHLDFVRERPDFARLAFTLVFGPQGEVPGIDLKEMGEQTRMRLVAAVDRAVRAALIRPECAETCANALHGLTIAWVLKYLANAGCVLGETSPDQILQDLLDGVRMRPQ